MTAAVQQFTAWKPLQIVRETAFASVTLGVALLVAGVAAADRPRIALALAVGLILLLAGLAAPRRMLLLLVVWLVALGFVRRLVSLAAPFDRDDPLLLAGTFGIAVLCAAALPENARIPRSTLATTVLLLQALLLLSVLNPAQGSLVVGLTGLLFLLVPTAGFWIGRGFGDDVTFERLLRLIAVSGGVVAVYGLLQTLEGFPSWDEVWIRDRGYLALNVGEATRPFGSFASSAEYALFLGVALVICLTFAFRSPLSLAFLGLVPLLGTAVFFSSTRGVVFTLAGALVLMAAAWRRLPLALAPVVAVIALLSVSPLTERLASTGAGGETTEDLVRHQVEGLSDPLDSESSTLIVHLSLIADGLRAVLADPLGAGGGTVTLSPARLGGEGGSTEADPSNLAVALGLPGFLAYVALVMFALRQSYRLASERRDALSLATLGILVVAFFQWFTGGHYAVTFLVWLALGWLDRACQMRGGTCARSPANHITHRASTSDGSDHPR